MLILLSACATVPRANAWIAAPTVGQGTSDVAVSIRRPPDTLARPAGRMIVAVHAAPAGTARVVVTRDWTPPFRSNDTLTLDPTTLLPIRETLHFNGAVRTYEYAGRRVTGTIAIPDSAPQAFDATYAEPVFAFNEVEPLVRSLSYRVGAQVVVPFFSEVDHAVEHDTLRVLSHDTAHGAWIVEFADPVITTRYTVDAATRTLRDALTRQRRSGLEVLYRYE